jgi:excisionase family DNA binding protein
VSVDLQRRRSTSIDRNPLPSVSRSPQGFPARLIWEQPAVTVNDTLMTTEELAAFLSLPVATLYQWRHRGTGPRAFRVGKHLRYRRADVEAFLESCGD